MKKVVVSGIVGGVILMIWSMITWMVIPMHQAYMKPFKNERAVANVIMDNVAENGVYVMPYCFDCGSDAAKDVPFMFASVKLQGMQGGMGPNLFAALILRVVIVGIVAWLVMQTRLNYNKKLGFLTLIGLIIGLSVGFPNVIWMGYPLLSAFIWIADCVIGWFLAGLAVAKILK